jgi:hypothetical protein
MSRFCTDSLGLNYSNLALAKKWWIEVFDCKQTKVPPEWDCPLPSDVALKLPGYDEPTILLSDTAEVQNAGYERSNDHPILFCNKLTSAQECLTRRGALPGPLQSARGMEFFELRDPEGNGIEICKEP